MSKMDNGSNLLLMVEVGVTGCVCSNESSKSVLSLDFDYLNKIKDTQQVLGAKISIVTTNAS